MLAELLRGAGIGLPPEADSFGMLVPFGVAMRYEDVIADAPPPINGDWLDSVVASTVAWADDCLNLSKD